MSDAFFNVQLSLYDALTASSEVQALLGNPPRIYDHVPPGAVFPDAVIGAVAAQPYDDVDRTGFTQIVTLDIWSRYRGGKEAKDILQAIYDVLHRATLSVTSKVFISCEFSGADFMQESDGLTTNAKAHFTVVTQGE